MGVGGDISVPATGPRGATGLLPATGLLGANGAHRGRCVFAGRIRFTFGLPRSGANDDEDVDYLIDALGRISQFAEVKES